MPTRREILQGAAALALLARAGVRPALAAAPAKAKSDDYIPETDPLVVRKLAQWSDWKFGLILHWGTYSQLGIVESWSICSEDEPWCKRPDGVGYVEWKRRYEQLPKTFNPVKFDPAQWADAAHAAGMRYVVFTTKHHDGFCMFDTATTDYRITAPDVPFHSNPRPTSPKPFSMRSARAILASARISPKPIGIARITGRRAGRRRRATTTTTPPNIRRCGSASSNSPTGRSTKSPRSTAAST